MRVDLAYGRDGASVEVPDDAEVVVPVDEPALPDEAAAITAALRSPLAGPPLADLLTAGDRVAVVFPDLTRPMPNRIVLPPLLAELARAGVPDERITLLCATGTHRQATVPRDGGAGGRGHRRPLRDRRPRRNQRRPCEGRRGGRDANPLAARVRGGRRPHHHRFRRAALLRRVQRGAQGGVSRAWRPRRRFSRHTTRAASPTPGPRSSPRTGNPVHDFVRAATAALAPPDLSLDVAINRGRRVTAVFAGPLPDAHDAACAHVQASAVREVGGAASTSWSRPTVATRSTATSTRRSRAWRPPSGSCVDGGRRDHGRRLRATACPPVAPSPACWRAQRRRPSSIGAPGGPELDRWQAQVLGRVLARAEVQLHSDGLDGRRPLPTRCSTPVADLDGAVEAALGRLGARARVAVLPEGPLTVATVAAGV